MKRYIGRKDSSRFQFLARVPSDLLDRMKGRKVVFTLPASGNDAEATVTAKIGQYVKFSLATRDAETAAVRRSTVAADLARLFDAARRGPAPISQRQILALSGEVYNQLIDRNKENPGSPEEWERFKALTRAALEGKIPSAPPISHQGRADDEIVAELLFGSDATAIIDALPSHYGDRSLEQRVGRLTLWVLDRHGIELDDGRRLKLMREIARAALQAAWTLKRMSGGDYRSDPDALRFPDYSPSVPTPRNSGTAFDTVFKAWVASEFPKLGSRNNRKTATNDFAKFLGHNDMSRITSDDIMKWRSALVENKLAPGTIKTKLSDVRAAFGYAFSQKMVPSNPFAGLRIAVKATRLAYREPKRGYTVAEVASILDLAGREIKPAIRWLPLLSATTGARITELVQLYGDRVRQIEGVWTLSIRPDGEGGFGKTEASARDVPIHPAVIEAGFLSFVERRGSGPLFYRVEKNRSVDKIHPSKNVADRVARWIRSQGFTDPSKAPNHAFRHYWKTRAHQCGVPADVADWLQGHRTPGEASRYRHIEADRHALAEAVARIPVPALSMPDEDREMPALVPGQCSVSSGIVSDSSSSAKTTPNA